MPVDDAGQLARRAGTRAPAGAFGQSRRDALPLLGLKEVEHLIGRDHVVPDRQLVGGRVRGDPGTVGAQRGLHRGPRGAVGQAVVPGQHDEAGEIALDIPFEGATQGLVEITQIEGQLPFRSSPQTEVQHVRIAAQLDVDPAVRRCGQIGGHDRRGAAVIRPR